MTSLTVCYHPERPHGKCAAGHPVHSDTDLGMELGLWTHCSVADLATCPYELADDPLTGHTPRHDSGAISG